MKRFVQIISLFAFGCAKLGLPVGGPKDTIPPLMVVAKPANKTLFFKEKKIVLEFNEYVNFQKLNSQMIISPLLKIKPVINPLNGISKKITIKISEDLLPNTTYIFNFGNGIVDHNEGNKVDNFSYIFSTGDHLDSLSMSGKVLDVISREKAKNVSVMIYKDINDTIFGNHPPNYLTVVDSVFYEIKNLPKGNYKIMVLEDKNNNYKYDKGSERIGFLNNSIDLKNDIILDDIPLFKESKRNNFFLSKQDIGNQIIIGFEGEEVPLLEVKSLAKKHYFISREDGKDSLFLWLKKIPKDSLFLKISQDKISRKYSLVVSEIKRDSLHLKSAIASVLHPFDTLVITSNIPILKIKKDSIRLLERDSISIPFHLKNVPEEQKIKINFDRKQKSKYKLIIKKSAFLDFFDRPNGEMEWAFSTLDNSEYGVFILKVTDFKSRLIVELNSETKKTKKIQTLDKPSDLIFKDLEPGKYKIKIIEDLNGNGRYDEGNFKLRKQPEPVYKVDKEIVISSKSELYETISLEKIKNQK